MKWIEKSTLKGTLKYRMPNVVEGYEFLSMIETVSGAAGYFKGKAKFISNLGPLLDFSACGYKDYSELLMDKENMMSPLTEIAQDVLTDITDALAKKP
ncbi:MAG: hypothetical protein HUM72_12460 [Dolichospermum sp.]|nr:hypothetical protein [Dolichospermum sp.]